jgi:hypothetical protein
MRCGGGRDCSSRTTSAARAGYIYRELHCLGIHHERLTYRFGVRDF